jgi:hypothetical protein
MTEIFRKEYTNGRNALAAIYRMEEWLKERYTVGSSRQYWGEKHILTSRERLLGTSRDLFDLTVSGTIHPDWHICYYNYSGNGGRKFFIAVELPDALTGVEFALVVS